MVKTVFSNKKRYAFLFALLACSLSISLPVYASSDYDDVFANTATARVSDTYTDPYNNHTCTSQDIASSWGTYLMDDSKWDHAVYGAGTDRETVQTAFSTALGNGDGWAVTEIEFLSAGTSIGNFVWGPGDHGVQIMFTPDTDNRVTFFSHWGDYATLKGTGSAPVYAVILGQYWNSSTSSCSIGVAVSRMVASDAANSTFVSRGVHVGMAPTVDYIYRQLFVNSPVTYPSGYEGVVVPSEYTVPPPTYVAMGDSFSSGEGVSPFEGGTDAGGVNECHRSQRAYPRLLESSQLGLGSLAFVACSGATTANVLNGQWNEPAQISALSEDTEIVTITIGGNDVGFKDFATACTIGSCDFATTAYSDIHGEIVDDLPGKLADVYEAIDGATSSTTNIYVVGYPQIAPAEMPTGPNSACWPLNGGTDNPDPELNDGATAYAVVSELNSVIHDAVTDMNSTKFHFVDPNLSGSPFIGHDWCQQDRYFAIIDLPNPITGETEHAFHPNVDGQEAYGAVVGGEIN